MRRACGAKVTRLTLGDLPACREARGAERCLDGPSEVSRGHSSRRTGRPRAEQARAQLVTLRSTDDGDAGKRAATPERSREAGDGIAEVAGSERQASADCSAKESEEAPRLLEEVLCRENVIAAYRRVVSNGGAPGVDAMSVDDLMAYCREHWAAIREQLYRGTYRPQPVRRVSIPKPGGGVRTLGIPTVLDRMIQQALHQVLQPIFDPTFADESYGFRPGRSALDAVERARSQMRSGHRWVVDLDIASFFDRVNHDVLMARVERRVKDRRVLRLIRRYLSAGMMEGGVVSPRREGTPQGGPLSPLLSNILLDELDRELQRRGHRFVRYADDCNVYVRSKAAGERVMASLERFLPKRLRLRLNRSKSAVDRPWKRTFLGYTATHHRKPRLRVSPKSVQRLKAKLKPLLRRGRGASLGRTCEELAPILRGWVSYYRKAEAKASFEVLDKWIRRRLRVILWRQWKRPRTRAKELRRRGIDPERARLSAGNGRGPWWNAGASHMNHAVPTRALRRLGLMSLLDEHRRLQCLA